MSKNMTKKNWLVRYVDMYDDSIKELELENMTADEAIAQADRNWPMDRAVEDYHLEPLNK